MSDAENQTEVKPWPTIKGFIRVTNKNIYGCSYFRNNGFGTIDQIAVARENVHIIGSEEEVPTWRVVLVANIEGKWKNVAIDEDIWSLAKQINEN